MRKFLLASTVIAFVIILITTFQNLAMTVDGLWVIFYQFDQKTSASFAVMVLTGIGFLCGVVTTMLAITLINISKDEEAPGGDNW